MATSSLVSWPSSHLPIDPPSTRGGDKTVILQRASVEVGDPEGSGGTRSAKPIGAKAAMLLEIIWEMVQAGTETPRHSELSKIAAKRGVRIDPTAISGHINVLETEGLTSGSATATSAPMPSRAPAGPPRRLGWPTP
jgi:hypothetical protein